MPLRAESVRVSAEEAEAGSRRPAHLRVWRSYDGYEARAWRPLPPPGSVSPPRRLRSR